VRPINGRLLLTISEAAAALRISRSSIYRLFEGGELAWVQIGASRRVTSAEIHRFIAAHTEAASKRLTDMAERRQYVLQPVRSELGDLAVQDLTRRQIDELIVKLRAGRLERPGGRSRKAWSARSCNYMLGALSQVLAQLVAEGRLARNVAALVDRVPGQARKFETFTADQVRAVLGGIAKDRNRHAWHLALAGLRRGEIAGLRWDDVDLDQRTVRIGKTRVDVGGRALDQDDSKTASAGRVLPLPDALPGELIAAKARQAAERLSLGEAYAGLDYVVCNEAGEPYHPSSLSTMWQGAIKNLAVPQVRLHDARHTCATLMHLQGVPIALVAAWLGHADVSLTLRTYVHAQPEALELAARSIAPPTSSAGD
jgi:integrase